MNAERYVCKEPFYVAAADDDGAAIDDAPPIYIPAGKVYECRRLGLNLDVWLTAEDGTWIDLDEDTFRDCFEKVID